MERRFKYVAVSLWINGMGLRGKGECEETGSRKVNGRESIPLQRGLNTKWYHNGTEWELFSVVVSLTPCYCVYIELDP